MAKKSKLSTPDWIKEGYDSPDAYNKAKGKISVHRSVFPKEGRVLLRSPKTQNEGGKKVGKTFKIRVCPECKSDEVGVVLSGSDAEEGGGKEWECHKCKWTGTDVAKKELTEDEFMKYLDDKEEPVA